MDITPQLLKDIKLSSAFHGYNRDEVDELIERVGVAIVQLQTRLREALERAEDAEGRAMHAASVAAPAPRSESEETLRRTLVLAQRTADAAIAEANAEAARTVADANEHAARTVAEANERASRLLSDAEAQAATLRTETEAEVRRIAEESRAPLMDDIRELERTRGFLRDDVELLERHLGTERERLRGQVAALARLIEGDTSLRIDPLPATSGIDAPAVASATAAPSVAAPAATAPAAPAPAAPAAPAPAAPMPEVASATIAPPSATVTPAFAPAAPATIDLPTEATPMLEELAAAPLSSATDDALRYTPIGAPAPAASTEPHWADDDFEDDDFDDEPVPSSSTPFLDQLRRAVDDEGADEGAMSDFFGSDLDESPRSRFGRRR